MLPTISNPNGSIYNVDAIKFMQALPNNSIQLIWTDPPFGTNNIQRIESTAKQYKDLTVDQVIDLLTQVGKSAYDALTQTGVFAICLDYRAVHQVYCKMVEIGFIAQGEIIWTFGLGRGASKWWANKHNTILLFSKTDKPKFNAEFVPLVNRKWPKKGYEGAKKVSSVWDITLSNTHPERVGYPNQKPLDLIKPFIEVHTECNDTVVDPFGGSGSTADAAKSLGRRFITNDINPEAVAVMSKRLFAVVEDNT
jgi:site-specific DNA-methyltransferase (adenine-specific)